MLIFTEQITGFLRHNGPKLLFSQFFIIQRSKLRNDWENRFLDEERDTALRHSKTSILNCAQMSLRRDYEVNEIVGEHLHEGSKTRAYKLFFVLTTYLNNIITSYLIFINIFICFILKCQRYYLCLSISLIEIKVIQSIQTISLYMYILRFNIFILHQHH